MNTDHMFQSNRAAWNEAVEYHQRARKNTLQIGFENPSYTTFDRDCDSVLMSYLQRAALEGKVIAQLPCNNGRELLSLMQFGAREAVGFDISDTAIAEAKQLAEIAKRNVKFERVNILEIDESFHDQFDFIYISEGSLQWFPDLSEYFSVISRLLKNNGRILIYEMHPFAYFFENGFDPKLQNWDDVTPYFHKGPYHYQDGLDYVGGVSYEAARCYWFMHKISDILKAVARSGIEIQDFEEYNTEMAGNATTALFDRLPLSYILSGIKRL